jgi:hypothetical protein
MADVTDSKTGFRHQPKEGTIRKSPKSANSKRNMLKLPFHRGGRAGNEHTSAVVTAQGVRFPRLGKESNDVIFGQLAPVHDHFIFLVTRQIEVPQPPSGLNTYPF